MTTTKKIEDGGPAHPLIIKELDPNSYPAPSYHEKQFFGLSVRDYFAGQALAAFGAAFLAGGWHHPNDYQIGVMVDGAYRAADAITAALSEKQAAEVVAYPISMVGDVLVDRYGVPVPTTEAPHSEGEDSAEVIATLEFVALWAWREDPPAAARNLSDGERLSAIKYHPTIKALAATHSGSATNSSGGDHASD